MGTPVHPDLAAGLLDRLSRDTEVAQVAARLAAYCADIDAALSPILGRRGVAALMHRSLRVASAAHPWLTVRYGGLSTFTDVAVLVEATLEQDRGAAAAGVGTLIQTFCELVASLIGASLTGRLLGPVLMDSQSAPTVSGHIE